MDLAALGNAGMITAEHIEEMIDWTTACRQRKTYRISAGVSTGTFYRKYI